MLGIKDMSGLLKPMAAYKLVSTLKEEIGIPIHLHTTILPETGVATTLMAAQAGVDAGTQPSFHERDRFLSRL